MTEILNSTENVSARASTCGPLRARMDGDVVGPGDADWDEARQAWNLAVDQRPAAVALPETAEDVAASSRFAREQRPARRTAGHRPQRRRARRARRTRSCSRPSGCAASRSTRSTRIARAEAGVIWIEVVEAAAEHGLAALAGSSPDVGVVGYTLGGGLSWLGRKHGLGANQRHRDRGRHRRRATSSAPTATNEPDLFWALRGGGGAFGVVTAIEFDLFPIERGLRRHPLVPGRARRPRCCRPGARWTDGLPDELTSVGRHPAVPADPGDPGARARQVVRRRRGDLPRRRRPRATSCSSRCARSGR